MRAGDKVIPLGWTTNSNVGSLRRVAEELELTEDDWMFMRHSSTAGVTFLPLPRWKLQAATPAEQVCLLVGATEDDPRDLGLCLADALSISSADDPLGRCAEVLEERGETDVLAALAEVDLEGPGESSDAPVTSPGS